nr:MAG TPA: hypothetical protein [Caudoviricetes sp.]
MRKKHMRTVSDQCALSYTADFAEKIQVLPVF